MRKQAAILVVDDLPEICQLYRSAVRRVASPFSLSTETDPSVAIRRVEEETFHLVVSDYRMPSIDGLKVLARARMRNPSGHRILMTGYHEITAARDEIDEADVDGYLRKPLRLKDLVFMLHAFASEDVALMRQWRLEARETEALGFASTSSPGAG